MTDGPDFPLSALPQLLDAEIALDPHRDTPAKHVAEALAMGIAAHAAGVPLHDESVRVNLRKVSR